MPAVELITSADTGLTFDLAAMLLDVAREHFTSDYERHGEAVAVYRFKQQVSHWSNQFAPELRGVARTIGNRMDGQTHRFQIAWSRVLHWHEQDQGETIALNTAKKRARIWAGAGGLEIIANDPYSPDGTGGRLRSHGPRAGRDKNGQRRGGPRMNGWDSCTFRVDFSMVVKGRRVYSEATGRWHAEFYAEPHDFTQIGVESRPFDIQPPDSCAEESFLDPSMTPHCPLNDPSLTPYCSSPVPSSVPTTVPLPVSPAAPGDGEGGVVVEQKQGENDEGQSLGEKATSGDRQDIGNIYIVRTWAKSGKNAYARLDRASRLSTKGAFSDVTVHLSPIQAQYMWRTWPADSPQRMERHIAYLLATPDERAALAGDVEADEETVDRVAACLVLHGGRLDLRAGVPGEIDDLAPGAVHSALDDIAGWAGVSLDGDRHLNIYWTDDRGRKALSRYFPCMGVLYFLGLRKRLYVPPWSLDELADDIGLTADQVTESLSEIVEHGDAVRDGEYTYLPTGDKIRL
jgi:hypothetical protein